MAQDAVRWPRHQGAARIVRRKAATMYIHGPDTLGYNSRPRQQDRHQ